jgi:hypothetical protein
MADWIQEQWSKGDCIPDPLLAILCERGDMLNDRAQWDTLFRRGPRRSAG